MFDAYDIIFDALLDKGYTEKKAEELIAQVIIDQKDLDNIAERIHNIIEQCKVIN